MLLAATFECFHRHHDVAGRRETGQNLMPACAFRFSFVVTTAITTPPHHNNHSPQFTFGTYCIWVQVVKGVGGGGVGGGVEYEV